MKIILIIILVSADIVSAIQYYYSNPVAFVQDIIRAEPQPEQAEFLNALATDAFIAIKSGHGIGKTAGEAWAILWFMSTHPYAKVPCTAPTGHQLDDILWPEVGKWLKQSLVKDAFELTKTKLWLKGYEDTWFSVPRSCNEPENLQGFHGDHVLFIIDEASGVPTEIMEVVEGALTNEGAHLLMAGNPNFITGTFYDAFHKDRTLYKTITFNSENSSLVSKEYCERIAEKFGKESDVYAVRVRGEFPKGNPDSLIRLEEIEPAINREVLDNGEIELGVDPARYGNDMSVICIRKGLKCLGFKEFSGINTTRLTGEVAQSIKQLHKQYGFYTIKVKDKIEQKIRVKIDDTGIGGGVTDQLEEIAQELGIDVIPINFGNKSKDPDYYNKAGEMWGNVKKILPTISIPDDSELITQFTSRKYSLHIDGTIKLEDKEHMKSRGLVSPDKADAFCLAFIEEKKPESTIAFTRGAYR